MTTIPAPRHLQRIICRCWALTLVAIVMTAMMLPRVWCAPEPPPTDAIERVDGGVINWSNGTLHAVGISSPQAIGDTAGGIPERVLMGAKANAVERLLHTARQVRIRSDLTIGGAMDGAPRVAAEFKALLQNLPVANQRYLSDGTAEIEMMLPLYSGPAQLLLPDDIRQVQPIMAIAPSPPPAPESTPPPAPTAAPSPKQRPYTGWVLDARGTGARAAMSIAVRDESGRTVYGSAFVSREFAVHAGMSGYSAVMDPAAAAARVGALPMTTRVLRAVGETRCDLVVSNADAARLRSAVAHLAFLRECRVLVVLDPQP
ncbi:MAG: hypothetical protein ABIL58_20445 [Pseudomonadota bacterium]